jgi:hypothetical protein
MIMMGVVVTGVFTYISLTQSPLKKVYSISVSQYGSEKSMQKANHEMWQIADKIFVKGLRYGSTPEEVHKVLGKPAYTTKSDRISSAMYQQDIAARDGEVMDTGYSPYPEKYQWKMQDLPTTKAKDSDILAETYVITFKFPGGRPEKRYWHIYYNRGYAFLQSYTTGIEKPDEWKIYLDGEYQQP